MTPQSVHVQEGRKTRDVFLSVFLQNVCDCQEGKCEERLFATELIENGVALLDGSKKNKDNAAKMDRKIDFGGC